LRSWHETHLKPHPEEGGDEIRSWSSHLGLGGGTLGAAAPAWAALTTFQTYTGKVGLSTDGWGNTTASSGVISAEVPAGATVLAAYLYTATQNFNGALVGNTLNGSAVNYGGLVFNGTACCTLASARADVTSIVKPIIDVGLGGIYNFTVVEGNTGAQDGGVVVVTPPSLATSSASRRMGVGHGRHDDLTFAAPDPTAAFRRHALGDRFLAAPVRGRT
jgi:hypothetical protein